MALIARLKTWAFQEKLASSDLNGEFNNIINNFSQDKVASTATSVGNFQSTIDPGEVGSESLPASLDEEVKQHRLLLKELSGEAQWYVSPASDVSTIFGKFPIVAADIATDAVETLKIKDLNVTTGKLAANAVTRAKQEAVGQQLSSSSGTYQNLTTSYTDVTNLSVTITTTGRPVFLAIITEDTTDNALISVEDSNAHTADAAFKFVRTLSGTPTDISTHRIKVQSSGFTLATDQKIISLPVSSLIHVDVIGANTYTYKLQARVVAGDSVNVVNAKLLAFEL